MLLNEFSAFSFGNISALQATLYLLLKFESCTEILRFFFLVFKNLILMVLVETHVSKISLQENVLSDIIIMEIKRWLD